MARLAQKIEEIAQPLWDDLKRENPDLESQTDYNFSTFCDEIRLSLNFNDLRNAVTVDRNI